MTEIVNLAKQRVSDLKENKAIHLQKSIDMKEEVKLEKKWLGRYRQR